MTLKWGVDVSRPERSHERNGRRGFKTALESRESGRQSIRHQW